MSSKNLNEVRNAYDKAIEARDKARQALNKAWQALNKATKALIACEGKGER